MEESVSVVYPMELLIYPTCIKFISLLFIGMAATASPFNLFEDENFFTSPPQHNSRGQATYTTADDNSI